MKRFLSAFAAWLAVLFVTSFFLLGWVFERGCWYRPVAALALLLAGFTCVLLEQADELNALKERLDALENGRTGAAEPPEKDASDAPKQPAANQEE